MGPRSLGAPLSALILAGCLLVSGGDTPADAEGPAAVRFLTPRAGQRFRADDVVSVSFEAARACTAALFFEGSMVMHAQAAAGQVLSHTIGASEDRGEAATLSLMTVILGAGGMHPAEEITIHFDRESREVARRAGRYVDERPGLGECGRAAEEASLPGGAWREGWYHPPGCRLRRFGQEDLHSCMANKTVLFAGDSLSRHVFVGFAGLALEGLEGSRRLVEEASEGGLLAFDDGMSESDVAEVREKCSRKRRYENIHFCDGKIRSEFSFGNGGSVGYYAMWKFGQRNEFIRDLYRRLGRAKRPDMLVIGLGTHELNAVRGGDTESYCPEECLCSSGFVDWFDTLKTFLSGDHFYRRVPTVFLLPSAVNEALKPEAYAWQNNDLVLAFNDKAKEALERGAQGESGNVRVFDTFEITRHRMQDSVDAVHFGSATNSVLAQVLLNEFCAV